MQAMLVLILMFVLPIYYISVLSENDWLFFLRGYQFRQKMKKAGYQHAFDYVDTLLETKEKEWTKKNKEKMEFLPFKNVTVNYTYERYEQGISIFAQNKLVFSLFKHTNSQRICYFYDYMQKSPLTQEQSLRGNYIIQHVHELFENKKEEQELLEKKEKEEIQQTKKERYIEQKELLEDIISAPPHVFQTYEKGDFLLKAEEKKHYITLFIFYKDLCYYQALYMKKAKKVDTIIHYKHNEESKPFKDLKDSLFHYANGLFSLMIDETEINQYSGEEMDISDIQIQIDQLASEEKWLSVESLHQLNETIPTDLQLLKEAYQQIQHQETAQEEVKKALAAVQNKLVFFQQEIEENKLNHLKKRRTVMEQR